MGEGFIRIKKQPHLEHCPFCGCEVWLSKYRYPDESIGYDIYGVHRTGCFLDEVSVFTTDLDRDALVEAWNNRTGVWQ